MSKATKLMKNGRPIVYDPSNQRAFKSGSLAGYVYEHIAIAEKIIGRPIRATEVVHHINGDATDNRENNLIVLHSNLDHAQLHKNHLTLEALEKLSDGSFAIKPQTIKCVDIVGHKFKIVDFVCTNCGKSFTARPCYRKRKNTFCSRECFTAYNTTDVMASITKDKLETIMQQYKSYVQAAKHLGVSDVTVKKYCKRFGVMKPA